VVARSCCDPLGDCVDLVVPWGCNHVVFGGKFLGSNVLRHGGNIRAALFSAGVPQKGETAETQSVVCLLNASNLSNLRIWGLMPLSLARLGWQLEFLRTMRHTEYNTHARRPAACLKQTFTEI